MALVYQSNKIEKEDAIRNANYTISEYRRDERARLVIDLAVKHHGGPGVDSIQDLYDSRNGTKTTRQRDSAANLPDFDVGLEFGKESTAVIGSSIINKWRRYKKIRGIKKNDFTDYPDLVIFGRYLVFAGLRKAAEYTNKAALHELFRGRLRESPLMEWKIRLLVSKMRRFSKKYHPQKAGIFELRHLRGLPYRLRNIAIVLITLGLRVQTATGIKAENVHKPRGSEICTIVTSDDKVLGDKARRMNFRCGCTVSTETPNASNDQFCIVHNIALTSVFPISFADINSILSHSRGGLHSFRRTAAITLRLVALQLPHSWETEHRESTASFIGWAKGSKEPSNYSSDHANFKLSTLVPVASLIRSALNVPHGISIMNENNVIIA